MIKKIYQGRLIKENNGSNLDFRLDRYKEPLKEVINRDSKDFGNYIIVKYWISDEKLPERSLELGEYFMNKLKEINNPMIKEIRGRGLFIGVELKESARKYCEELKEHGLLCKETHESVIRFAPPLVINKEELDWAIDRIKKVLG
jgi:hypothetical protein